ncbi:MAG: cation:proton antiporter [Bacteroidota bacterium]
MVKKLLFPLIIIGFFLFGILNHSFAQEKHANTNSETVVENSDNVQLSESNHESESSEGSHEEKGGMEPLFFIIIALLIGAATRHFFRKFPLPFTVLLLIFGIGLGLLNRYGVFDGWGDAFGDSLIWAGHINPHAILFIFLPILIFEAAFAMDLHTFKKTATNSIILAVPGIIVSLVLSACLVIILKVLNIGLYSWEWNIALMFGSVISATDPVAVVALLKDLGASKKLGTLIEGESILNDGTAIVFFMVFFTGISGLTSDNHAAVEFGRVAFGGIAIGIIIAAVLIAWVKRVFNDALVEISVIIAAAYLTFYVAEHFLHMSGVLGLCALGLAMAGVGKTRISPEVGHFLHEFWELAAFIANTLIFLIVGVVIAQQTEFSTENFIILGIFYIGVHIVRGIMIFMFYPIMKRIGYGISVKESVVLWYGALRGAIALALALVVNGLDDSLLAPEVKNQFFFITAGIVTLTLLINATTIKLIVNKLKLTKIPAAKAMMIYSANQYLRSSTENAVERIKTDRFLSSANWGTVNEFLPKDSHDISEYKDIQIDTMSEMRKRVLEKEKSSYWYQFKEGMLGSIAVRRLSDQIDEIMDSGGLVSLSKRKDLELLLNTPKLLSKMQSWPLVNNITKNRFFERLSTSYEIARGFVEAQEEVIKLVESMHRSLDENDKSAHDNLTVIESEINENKIEGLTFIRNLRKTYPEIYDAISTRHAIRTLLNFELKTVERLQKNGRIDSGEAHKMVHSIEERMKKLLLRPPKVKTPEPSELMDEVSWLRNLDSQIKTILSENTQSRIFSVGEKIIKEGSTDDSLYIIARGSAKVYHGKDDVIDILGSGSIVGEMAALTNKNRCATVEVESPLTAIIIPGNSLKNLIKNKIEFKNKLWGFAALRIAENHLRTKAPFHAWRQKDFHKWLRKSEIIFVDSDKTIDLTDKAGVLVFGKASTSQTDTVNSPAFINNCQVNLEIGCIIVMNTVD